MGIGVRKEVGKVKTEDLKLSVSRVKSPLKKVGVSWATGVMDGGVEETTSDSNCSSWPMKLKLGEMMARRFRMTSKACSSCNRWVFMMYAMQMVGEREIPASQWTSTLPPFSFTRSVERKEHEFIMKALEITACLFKSSFKSVFFQVKRANCRIAITVFKQVSKSSPSSATQATKPRPKRMLLVEPVLLCWAG